MFISVLEKIILINEKIFSFFDNIIISFLQNISMPEWVIDAICDSVHLLPLLFIVFLFIEFLEFYYSDKINNKLKKNGIIGIIAGSFAAILPQCGFSVIASSLYSKKIITRGALIAVFLATSDETIPILLATPNKINLVLPIIGIKLFLGILAGFIVDKIMPCKNCQNKIIKKEIKTIEEGCCKHDIIPKNKRELIIHPITHTANIFSFILVITLILNFLLDNFEITKLISENIYIQPVITGTIGLIPNCAISIGTTMLLIKGVISFGGAMSCLLANAGLGLLVLLKNNDFVDTVKIMLILLAISIISGIGINIL